MVDCTVCLIPCWSIIRLNIINLSISMEYVSIWALSSIFLKIVKRLKITQCTLVYYVIHAFILRNYACKLRRFCLYITKMTGSAHLFLCSFFNHFCLFFVDRIDSCGNSLLQSILSAFLWKFIVKLN